MNINPRTYFFKTILKKIYLLNLKLSIRNYLFEIITFFLQIVYITEGNIEKNIQFNTVNLYLSTKIK